MNESQDQDGRNKLGDKEQKQLLEEVVEGNRDLTRLEAELTQFNLFEANGNLLRPTMGSGVTRLLGTK